MRFVTTEGKNIGAKIARTTINTKSRGSFNNAKAKTDTARPTQAPRKILKGQRNIISAAEDQK
jgi:hypothetical protein